jgi:hypothetical protein
MEAIAVKCTEEMATGNVLDFRLDRNDISQAVLILSQDEMPTPVQMSGKRVIIDCRDMS